MVPVVRDPGASRTRAWQVTVPAKTPSTVRAATSTSARALPPSPTINSASRRTLPSTTPWINRSCRPSISPRTVMSLPMIAPASFAIAASTRIAGAR